jgi:ribosomal protein RSM22 (predicted rRNA methylase)
LFSVPSPATWAALTQRDDLQRATLIERDRGFIDLGRRLLAERAAAGSIAMDWQAGDLRAAATVAGAAATTAGAAAQPLPPHDLVIVSYALGELREGGGGDAAARRLIARAWEAARQVLIVIEPGTPHHFAGVLQARDDLIRSGACLVAPCPHSAGCPMAGVDWCHLPARVERTSLHRRLKSAALPYEDEKFSYVMVARTPIPPAPTRIVRRPEIQKGFITLTLCTPDGLQRQGVPRSQREAFRRARKVAWGDAY